MSDPTTPAGPPPVLTAPSEPVAPYGDSTARRRRSRGLGIASLVLGILLACGVAIWVTAGVLLWAS